MRRWPFLAGCLGVLLMLATACATTSDRAALDSIGALTTTTAATTTSTPSPTTAPTRACGIVDEDHLTSSLRPLDPPPAPGHMPAGSFMADIATDKRIVVGVDENTLYLSFRDQRNGQFAGFEIDLVYQIAHAIFGDDTLAELAERVDFVPVITDEKVSVVENDDVDMTVSAVSMTCARWKSVLFSTPYFHAQTKVQVRTDKSGDPVLSNGSKIGPTRSPAELNEQLRDRRVCATKGSTSIGIIEANLPDAIPVAVPTRTDCLMQLQEGTVDAISTHDTFLLGFEAQDPDTKILEPMLNEQPYGIAIAQDHPEFVRFVNGVLQRLAADGTLQKIYDQHFGPCGDPCDALDDPLPGTQPVWLD